jgi:hypothetical protein
MTRTADQLISEGCDLDTQIRASVAEPKCPVDAGAPLCPATVYGPRRAPCFRRKCMGLHLLAKRSGTGPRAVGKNPGQRPGGGESR